MFSIGLSIVIHAMSVSAAMTAQPTSPVEFIGAASIDGDSRDRSRLYQVLGGKIPQNRLGSFGSGIDFTGSDDLYIACDDRGPGDGAFDFRPRVQMLRISVNPTAVPSSRVTVELVRTVLLRDENGASFTGLTSGFDRQSAPEAWPRLDPEAIRMAPESVAASRGAFYISDEYGPAIDLFASDGQRLRRLPVPSIYAIAAPDADPERELPPFNTRGRQANRGFEGLAITPSGDRLFAMPQSPLIQDHALDPDNNRIGLNIRLLELNTKTGDSRQLVYPLENSKDGVSEVLAASDSTLLVLERDGKGGVEARRRGVFLAALDAATDVSSIDSLPARSLPDGIRPITKRRLIDLLDPSFALYDPSRGGMPEKIEGLCFGPRLDDGRRVLLVTTDNDLKADQPTWIWAFAVSPEAFQQP